jgi:hypothetical protein
MDLLTQKRLHKLILQVTNMDILSRLKPDRARNSARQPSLPSHPGNPGIPNGAKRINVDQWKSAKGPTPPLAKPTGLPFHPTPTPMSETRAPGPIDRGNSPLADVPGTEAWGAKMAGIHNMAGFIGRDGKRST